MVDTLLLLLEGTSRNAIIPLLPLPLLRIFELPFPIAKRLLPTTPPLGALNCRDVISPEFEATNILLSLLSVSETCVTTQLSPNAFL